MHDKSRSVFIAGLKDAYALEKQAYDMMQSQAKRLEDYPDMRQRAQRHAEETRRQIQRLEQALDKCGESPSMIKDMGTRTVGMVQSFMHSMAPDEIIKDSLVAYAFEHFEIASYRSLIAMADFLGEREISELCQASLVEEQDMARWLDEHLDVTTRKFMQRREAMAA